MSPIDATVIEIPDTRIVRKRDWVRDPIELPLTLTPLEQEHVIDTLMKNLGADQPASNWRKGQFFDFATKKSFMIDVIAIPRLLQPIFQVRYPTRSEQRSYCTRELDLIVRLRCQTLLEALNRRRAALGHDSSENLSSETSPRSSKLTPPSLVTEL